MKKFNIIKFFTYLTIGLCILGSWGYLNYANYTIKEHLAQVQIVENVTMINETVEDIEIKQDMLRTEQRVAPVPMLALESAPTTVNRFDRLERRIIELEKEKAELKSEKIDIKARIREAFSLFKFDYENPMVNAIGIPILLYFFKKLFDLVFARFEERLSHNFEEEHEHEA